MLEPPTLDMLISTGTAPPTPSQKFKPHTIKNLPPTSHLLPLIHLCRHTSEFAQLHATLIKLNLSTSSLFSTRLLAALSLSPSSSSSLSYALRLFLIADPKPNSFAFNVLIRGLSQSHPSHPALALSLFRRMLAHGGPRARPNSMTFPFVFRACSALAALDEGQQVHAMVCKLGMVTTDVFIQNALMNLYVKAGRFDDARKVFDRMSQQDVVSWNVVIAGLVDLGSVEEAKEMFDGMLERNVASWNCLIGGFVRCGSVETARDLFEAMSLAKNGITWNTMISGYVGCERMDEAHGLFRRMPREMKDVMSFNAMIDGYSKRRDSKEVLELFNEMLGLEIEPNSFTLVSTLSACSQLLALEQGKWIHSYIARCGTKLDAVLGTALLDMYAKCGDIERAIVVFSDIDKKDISAWNSMISNLGIHGKGKEALRLFFRLLEAQWKPDDITFLSVLSACRHSGLVKEGRSFFNIMREIHGITPKAEHFGCMVDLLCRAQLLFEARELIEANLGMEFSVAMWGALLEASSRVGDVEMGEYAAKNLLELDPGDTRCYVALSNLYSKGEKWSDSLEVRKLMRSGGMEKVPGCSLIEVNGVVHEFRVGSDFNVVDE